MRLIDMIVLGFLALVLLPLGCYGGSQITVSDGYRDSTIRKASTSGVIWPTYEVESLGVVAFPKSETFQYSVRVADKALFDRISTLPAERRVRVHYRKVLVQWLPAGESRYFITRIEELP